MIDDSLSNSLFSRFSALTLLFIVSASLPRLNVVDHLQTGNSRKNVSILQGLGLLLWIWPGCLKSLLICCAIMDSIIILDNKDHFHIPSHHYQCHLLAKSKSPVAANIFERLLLPKWVKKVQCSRIQVWCRVKEEDSSEENAVSQSRIHRNTCLICHSHSFFFLGL